MNKYNVISLLLLSGPVLSSAQTGSTRNYEESRIICQSPDVAAMARCVDKPVSYFNGSVGITIPLCEVEAEDITLPISLSYDSNGFKPSQEATWVGLGWHMSLNACITRYIKCVDDLLEYNQDHTGYVPKVTGYYGWADVDTSYTSMVQMDFGPCPVNCGATALCTHIYRGTELIVDSEPDIFSYSLWNGGDKFVLTDNPSSPAKATFMDKAAGYKLNILKNEENKYYFELVANNGTIYEFKQREITHPFSGVGQANVTSPYFNYAGENHGLYASSWMLTKIITPKKGVVQFNYEREEFFSIPNETCIMYHDSSYGSSHAEYMPTATNYGQSILNTPLYSWSKAAIESQRLTSITWDHGRIDFVSSPRADTYTNAQHGTITPHKLDRIEVRNARQELIKCFVLDYDYFGSNTTGSPLNDCLYKRLKLVHITDSLTPNYRYSFVYDESMAFPSKQCKGTDYWGYFNGDYTTRSSVCAAIDPYTNTAYAGNAKNSSYDATMLGMLTEISYPTGGREHFNYELHRFLFPHYTQTGGLRLTSSPIVLYSSTSGNHHAEYVATTQVRLHVKGMLNIQGPQNGSYGIGHPLLTVENRNTHESTQITMPNIEGITHVRNDSIVADVRLDAGTYDIYSHDAGFTGQIEWRIDVFDGLPVTYSRTDAEKRGAGLRVKEIAGNGKNRKFIYEMGTMLIEPILYQTKTIITKNIEYNEDFNQIPSNITFFERNVLAQFSESSIPLSSFAKGYEVGYDKVTEQVGEQTTEYNYHVSREQRISANPFQSAMPDFRNGLLTSKTIRQGASTLYSENISYGYRESPFFKAYDFTYSTGLTQIPNYRFAWYYPTHITTSVDGTYTTESISYNADLLASNITTTRTEGLTTQRIIKYTPDGSCQICQDMTASNIIVPIQEVNYVNGKKTSGLRYEYQRYTCNGRYAYLPYRICEMSLDCPENILTNPDATDNIHFRTSVSYDAYDGVGNPLQITRKGIPTTYVWGYHRQYPIAELTNFRYNDFTNSQRASLAEISVRQTPMQQDWTSISQFWNTQKSLYGKSSALTLYHYKPLVGITSTISPNGLRTDYEYDSAGRLTNVYWRDGSSERRLLKSYDYHYIENQ